MNIRVFKSVNNGVYTITIRTEDWSEGDKRLMERFGEPTIDLGGNFVDESPYLAYDLPTDVVRIMSESPFKQSFDIRDNADAESRANLWKEKIATRITDEVLILRSNNDVFTGEEVTTV